MNKFVIGTRIYYGNNSLNRLTQLRAKRAFIVTDPFIIQSGAIDRIIERLEKAQIFYQIFSDVVPNPPIKTIVKGIVEINKLVPDVVIAVGGGSAIDTAKGICFMKSQLARSVEMPNKNLRFIAIPTTSGTGSEITDYCVITDETNKTKYVIAEESMLPDEAMLDVKLVKTVPPTVTADTGIDVLTHALEAYVSTKASDFTDALAQKAIDLVFHYLPRAYRDGNDEEARTRMHHASTLAGMAFTNAGLGINHGMAHAIGAKFDLTHGRANAILIPYVVRFNSCLKETKKVDFGAARRYAEIADFLRLPGWTTRDKVENLILKTQNLLKELKIPINFKDAGLSASKYRASISELASRTLKDNCTATNPRRALQFEIEDLFKMAYG